MFSRGEIYDKESMEAAEALKLSTNTAHRWEGLPNDKEVGDLRKRIEDVSDDDPLEKRIKDAELLRDLYERNDKQDEAQKLNEQIQNAKKALKEQQERKSNVDFSNPTPEMIADAEKYGLDLTDPLVQAELRRIENEDPEVLQKEMDDEEERQQSGGPVEMPLPEAPEHVPIPWMRYIVFFGGIILLLRISDVYFLLRNLFVLIVRLLSGSDDTSSNAGGGGGSIFAKAYKLLFAPSGEESE